MAVTAWFEESPHMTSYSRDSLRRIPWREVLSCVRTSEVKGSLASLWNDLHSLCRIGMEYYLLNDNNNNNNNDNNDNNIMMMMMMMMMMIMIIIIIMIIIRMMTMMIIGTIMITIIIITTTLTVTIMKMIMIKTAQTPCQSLYKDRRI